MVFDRFRDPNVGWRTIAVTVEHSARGPAESKREIKRGTILGPLGIPRASSKHLFAR